MQATIHMTFQFNALPGLADHVSTRVSQAVRKTLFDAQKIAQQMVPVDKGAAKNSIHVVLPDFDGQPEAIAAVKAANPRAGVFEDPETVSSPLSGLLVVAVIYGWFIEYGTFHPRTSETQKTYRTRNLPVGIGMSKIEGRNLGTYTPARPFIRPAVEMAAEGFELAIGQAIEQGASDGGGK